MGDYDMDLVEYFYKVGVIWVGLMKLFCKDLSKVCVGKIFCVFKVVLDYFINLFVWVDIIYWIFMFILKWRIFKLICIKVEIV